MPALIHGGGPAKTKLSNDQARRESGSHEYADIGRRGFMLTTTLAAAGAGAAGLLKPFSAEAAPRAESKKRGMVGVGKVSEPHQIGPFSLLRDRTSFASSQIGGIRETQELVHFCALHDIRPEITKIRMAKIDEAWTNVVQKEARYRFVIDMTNA